MNLTKTSRRGRASREAAAEPRRNPRNERPNQRPPWEEPPTVAGNVAKGATILAVLAVILLPIYSVIMTSFSTKASVDAAGGLVVVPEGGVTLNAYREIIQGGVVTRALVVSLGVTVVGTALLLAASGLGTGVGLAVALDEPGRVLSSVGASRLNVLSASRAAWRAVSVACSSR